MSSTKREKHFERVLILRTLMNYGAMYAADLADRANSECDLDALDGVPDITRRGIGMKLDSLHRLGFVAYAYPEGPTRPRLWTITNQGESVAMSLGRGLGPVDPNVRLRALRTALQAIVTYLSLDQEHTSHEGFGAACGTDACFVCLAEQTARDALRGNKGSA